MRSPKPKYSLIADQLTREINDGTIPLGASFPTEANLMRAFGVSRHTVRAALRQLRSRGLISSKQGQGSHVIAVSEQAAFTEQVQSIDELVAFGQETRRELLSRHVVQADANLARMFGCDQGRRLVEIRMIRKTLGPSPKKLAIVTLWLDALLSPVVESFEEMQKSAAEIIREQFGLVTKVVLQTIQAEILTTAEADILDTETGAPALIVTRRYCETKDERPFLIARSICKADSLHVASKFTASG